MGVLTNNATMLPKFSDGLPFFQTFTSHLCSVCRAPLCTTPLLSQRSGTSSCWEKWHGSNNSKGEHVRCQEALKSQRVTERVNRTEEKEEEDEAESSEAESSEAETGEEAKMEED